jgi:CRP/FNR family nitrogen fixation transcriptional regulator
MFSSLAFSSDHRPGAPRPTPWAAVPSGPVLHFTADGGIYGEGDETRSFYKIVSGVVRTCKFLSDGRRQIDAFHVAGDVFGFEMGAEHRLTAEAVTDCSVISYRRRGAEMSAASDDGLARQFLSHAMRSLERAQEHSLLLGRRSAQQKLAAFLLDLADRGPDDDMVELAMTRLDIADYLGLTIETVSRTFSQLERDDMIQLVSIRRIRLKDRGGLHALGS